jgi:hypothetical protein
MNRTLIIQAVIGALSALAVAALIMCTPSSPALSNAAVAADVAAYTAEQEDCLSGSTTLPVARACVTQVRARWCGPGGQLAQVGGCGDGGTIPMTDAGGQ